MKANQKRAVAWIFKDQNRIHRHGKISDILSKKLGQLQTDGKFTKEQTRILSTLPDNIFEVQVVSRAVKYRSKGKTPTVTSKAIVIQTKSPAAKIAKELFAMINKLFPSCLEGGMRIIPQGVDHIMGYDN